MKAKRLILLLSVLIVGIFAFAGCVPEQDKGTPADSVERFNLTLIDADHFLIEDLKATYRAGEKVTVKTGIIYDASLIVYLDGVPIRDAAFIDDGDYRYWHWEHYFIMPEHDATLRFEVSGGM